MAATAQPPQFSCPVDHRAARAVVSPRGELDLATVAPFQATLDDAVASGVRSLVVDLGHLSFLDSSGLRCLLVLAERARRDGLDLEFLPAPANVMRVVDLTGTRDVLPFRAYQ